VSDAERAEAAFWATFLRNRNVDATTAGDGAVAVAGGYALCAAGTAVTYAIGAGAARPLRADDFEVVEGFYDARGLPARFELEVETLTAAETLLRDRGYQDEGLELAVYAGPVATRPVPEGIAVRRTTDRTLFADLLVRGAAETIHDVGVLHRSAVLNASAGTLVVASIGGTDVGVGALGVSGDAAFFYSGAVLPAYRGRGVHGALIAGRMNLAAGLGVSTAITKTAVGSPVGRTAERFGLVPAGTRRRLIRAA
jgi:GNAT superfamily N-acetyltransferase